MRRLLLAVEGQTEERFVKDVLAPALRSRGIEPIPTLIRTKEVSEGGHFKGGLVKFRHAEQRISKLLLDSDAVLVTTMFDYSGRWKEDFLTNYRGGKRLAGRTPLERVNELQNEIQAHFKSNRFRAVLVLHEFEALLFSQPDVIAHVVGQRACQSQLAAVRGEFRTPEDINDNPTSTPSRRLSNIIERYQKALHGPLIATRIGLDVIRRECPHFGSWLTEWRACRVKYLH